jgi:hypothetical protein
MSFSSHTPWRARWRRSGCTGSAASGAALRGFGTIQIAELRMPDARGRGSHAERQGKAQPPSRPFLTTMIATTRGERVIVDSDDVRGKARHD